MSPQNSHSEPANPFDGNTELGCYTSGAFIQKELHMKRLSIAFAILLAGCAAQMGKPIDQKKMLELEEGETTKDQAIEYFGPPMNVVTGSNGKTIMMWMHGNTGVWGAQKSQSLSITFDESGVMESYFSSNTEPANR